MPTRHRIIGVTKRNLSIRGILLAKVEYAGKSTNTAVYICDGIDSLFLSRKIQTDLGIIPEEYPNVSKLYAHTGKATQKSECGCPLRQPVPARPEKIPYEPTEENRQKIADWITDTFAPSSAFNTCEHQPTEKMSGEPLSVHFKEDARAVAVHVPIPVAFHWKQKVSEDMARDVRLKVIEKVPPGTPTTWCSRMVVVSKKDGTP